MICSVAAAETYYVSLAGNDGWNGKTPATAFRTIVKGCSVLQAGDTLIIKSGNYGNEQVTLTRSGTAIAPITIRAEEPGKVILTGAGSGSAMYMRNKSHIVIDGIEFGNYSAAVRIWHASTYVTVRRCVFRENNTSGITVYGRFTNPGASHDIVLTENTFLDFRNRQDYGLCLYASTNLKATNNYFYGQHHQALSFKKLMKDSVASGNTFEGFLYSAIYVGQNDDSVEEGYLRSERIVVENNVFRPARGYRAKRPICIANVSDAIVRNNFVDSIWGGDGEGAIAVHPIATGAKIYNNLIINENGNGQPAMFIQADAEVYNNTVVGCKFALEVFTGTRPLLRNNIFQQNQIQVKVTPGPIYSEGTEHKTRRFPDGTVWTWRPEAGKNPVFEHNNWWLPDWPGKGATDISADSKFVGPFTPYSSGPLVPKFVPDWTRSEPYHLAAGSPCIDAGMDVGLPYNGSAPDIGAFEWEYVQPAVVGREVFYNGSIFDGYDPAPNADDDNAIATDKTALLPGQTAAFANYTSCIRGINGIMVDIADVPGTPGVGDFVFKVGNDDNPDSWAAAPSPASVTVRPGAGVDGSARVTIIWANAAIQKQWLQVTVKATAATGLSQPDVFYFGNAIGDSGNSQADTKVDTTDEVRARLDPYKHQLNPAGIENPHDYTRDGVVDTTDEIIARAFNTTLLDDLNLITAP